MVVFTYTYISESVIYPQDEEMWIIPSSMAFSFHTKYVETEQLINHWRECSVHS